MYKKRNTQKKKVLPDDNRKWKDDTGICRSRSRSYESGFTNTNTAKRHDSNITL